MGSDIQDPLRARQFLEEHWEQAVDLAGLPSAKSWRLYMAGSALGFEAGRISVFQVLGVKSGEDGSSGVPLTRSEFLSG